MKALSLWQPWASAIALGYKQIETRHWSTRYRGPIAIHAAKRWTGDEGLFGFDMMNFHGDPRLARPPLGGIVAVAELANILRTEDLSDASLLTSVEEQWGNYAPGRFAWVLTDIRALPEPIPYSGHQGLFNVPDELVA